MNKVTVYTKKKCPQCIMTKKIHGCIGYRV